MSITFSRRNERISTTPCGMHACSSCSSSASESSPSDAPPGPPLAAAAASAGALGSEPSAPASAGGGGITSSPSRPPEATAADAALAAAAASWKPRRCECHSTEWHSICAFSPRSRVLSCASSSSRNSLFPPVPPSGTPSHERPRPSRKSSCRPIPCTRKSRCFSLTAGGQAGPPEGGGSTIPTTGPCRLGPPARRPHAPAGPIGPLLCRIERGVRSWWVSGGPWRAPPCRQRQAGGGSDLLGLVSLVRLCPPTSDDRRSLGRPPRWAAMATVRERRSEEARSAARDGARAWAAGRVRRELALQLPAQRAEERGRGVWP
eukprot:scaffold162596_cov24-Tisochrysis_lutea.AAC.1